MMWCLMTEVVGSALCHSCWRPCGTEGLWCCSLALQCCQLQLQHTLLLPAAVHISCAGNRCSVEMDPDILPLLFCPACADPLSANLILHYNMQGTQETGCQLIITALSQCQHRRAALHKCVCPADCMQLLSGAPQRPCRLAYLKARLC